MLKYLFILLYISTNYSYKITFNNFIYKKQLENNYNKNDDVINVLNNMKKSALHINKIISLSYLNDIDYINNYNSVTYNVHNEKQKRIDLLANNIIKKNLESQNIVNVVYSEEEVCETIINIKSSSKIILAYDPLDGSSNIESSMPMGTIFALYKDCLNFDSNINSINKLNMISAGYILYSSSIHLVFYLDRIVYHFIYDEYKKDFILFNDKIKIPNKGNIYSINEAKINNFKSYHKNFIDELKQKDYTSRYHGCLVADFHNILINGGIFMYPKDIKNNKNKLRLLYEAKPLAKIIKHCGGICMNENNNINNIKLNKIHDTTSLYFGSIENINEFKDFKNK